MKSIRLALYLGGLGAAAVLSACGGGGGSSAPAAAPNGMVNVQVTDAPTTDFDHVWVTIREIRFHTSDAVAADDPGWLKYPLATPVSVDLAALDNGSLAPVFDGLTLPVGTYQQIRLLLVSDNAPLSGVAQAAGLTYNDQIDWTDTGGSHIAPLEIPAPVQGIGINGTFTVSAGAPLNLVLDFDVGHDVVRFIHGGNNAYTLKPNLKYFDLSEVGAVTGSVATANLCTSAAAAAPTNCAYNLVIKAEQLSADGTYHMATRYTTVRSDGTFTLYPLRVPAGQTSTTVDVLVRGRNMDTVLVRNVPVTAGTAPASSPTMLSSTPLPLTIDAEYLANASAPVAPTGSWSNTYQTVSSISANEVPYEVRYRHVNPFTGLFTDNLPLSTGPLQIGGYVAGGSPTLIANTPVQGNGGFLVFASAPDYLRTEATSDPLLPVAQPAIASFTLPTLAVNPAVASANSISGVVSEAVAGTYDSGYVVVVRLGTIVQTLPISSQLATNGGSFTIGNLPGGTSVKPLPGAYYYLYARVWNSANPQGTKRRIDFSGFADLRTGSASGINVMLD